MESVKLGCSGNHILLSVLNAFCLHLGDTFSAHIGKILTFPLIKKGACLGHKPFLFGAPESVFERFVATLFG